MTWLAGYAGGGEARKHIHGPGDGEYDHVRNVIEGGNFVADKTADGDRGSAGDTGKVRQPSSQRYLWFWVIDDYVVVKLLEAHRVYDLDGVSGEPIKRYSQVR